MGESYYPNRFAADWFAALDEVVGGHGAGETLTLANAPRPSDKALSRAYPFAALGRVNAALDSVYGARGGRGMALRSGRAWFAGGMRTFGSLRGVSDPAFRRLAVPDRCRVVLHALADIFTQFSDQAMHLEMHGAECRLTTASPFAEGFVSPRPVCGVMIGLLQEAMLYASNGRDLLVREPVCRAAGHSACVFVVHILRGGGHDGQSAHSDRRG